MTQQWTPSEVDEYLDLSPDVLGSQLRRRSRRAALAAAAAQRAEAAAPSPARETGAVGRVKQTQSV